MKTNKPNRTLNNVLSRLKFGLLGVCIMLGVGIADIQAQECTNTTRYPSAAKNLATPDEVTISSVNELSEYSEVTGIVSGYEYEFSAVVNSDSAPAYITVRTGTSDGAAIAAGFSPLTITATSSDNLFLHWNVDATCATAPTFTTTTGICVTCATVEDCEGVAGGSALPGSACDDLDESTINDVYDADCNCAGIIPPNGMVCEAPIEVTSLPYSVTDNTDAYGDDYGSGDRPALAPDAVGSPSSSYLNGDDVVYAYTPSEDMGINISVTEHGSWAGVFVFTGCPFESTVGGFTTSSATTDLLVEGLPVQAGVTYYIVISTYASPQSTPYTLNIDEASFDCPDLMANIGDACDDGDASTVNDVISEDCECAGELPAAGSVCASAIALDCNAEPATYSSTAANGTNTTECSMGDNGLWFSFVGTGGDITVNSSATFDHEMSINSGSCGSLVNIDCDDQSINDEEYTISASVDGEMYYVYIARYNSGSTTTGDITIDIDCAVIPVCTPTELALEVQDVDGNPIDGCLEADGEYYVEATLSGGEGNTSYNVSVDDIDFVEVDANGSAVFGPISVGTDVNASAIGVQDGDCVTYATLDSPEICGPGNDDCSGAIALSCGDTLFGNTDAATASGLDATCGSFGSSDARDLFYSFEADGTSNYLVSASAEPGTTNFDGVLFVYSGTCDTLTSLGCSDSGNPEEVELIAPDAGTYTVRAFDYAGTGSFTLSLECTPAISGYVYESGAWTPMDPNGNATASDDITVIDGEASFTGDIEVNNITVNSGATLNVESVLTINGDITNNGDMIFKSTATSDGELAAVPATSSITGEFTVERYTSANRAYRFVSSPVTTSASIHANWQEGATSATDNPNPGFGTHITGSTTDQQNGFDATVTGNPSLFTLDATSQAFAAVVNTDVNTITAGEGYLLFVRGDRSMDLGDNASVGATVLRSRGALHTGGMTQTSNLSSVANEFNLIANPYQSAIDITSVIANSQNLNTNYCYVYDPTLGVNGAYVTVDLSDGSNGASSDANQYVQPGQAVQVAATGGGTVEVVFSESDKAPGNHTGTFRAEGLVNANGFIKAQLYTTENYVSGAKLHDNFMIHFSSAYNNALTQEDAIKAFNFTENMGIGSLGAVYSIERREMPVDAEEIQLFTDNYEHQGYTLLVETGNLGEAKAYFVDSFTEEEVALVEGESLINFNVDLDSEQSKATDRFYLRFEEQGLFTDSSVLDHSLQLYPNPTTIESGFYLSSSLWKDQQVSISVRDLLGREVYSAQEVFTNGKIHVSPGNSLGNGTYFVEVKQGDQRIVKRFITK